VRELRWDDAANLWHATLHDLATDSDSEHSAHVVITAAGQLSAPADPRIPGLREFDGPVFHSAEWRHDLDLAGRRVAIIGTGASAIQFVPEVVQRAAHVDLYQRSAPYIIGKSDRRYSGLEKKVFARFPVTQRVSRLRQYLWHEVLGTPFVVSPQLMVLPSLTFRLRLRREVRDPLLRRHLQPGYTMGCKRLLRSSDWYQSITRFNVRVVTDPIERVTAKGVETAGELREADVVILATGFDATSFLAPMRITGRNGRELNQEWSEGAHAYLGTAVSGFPNLFLLYGPGTNLGHSSILFMIESQLNWVRDAVRSLRDLGLAWIDVRGEVQSEYDAQFRAASAKTVWETGCTSWYTVNGRNTNNWPRLTYGFHRRTRRVNVADITTAPVDAPDGEYIAGAVDEVVGGPPAQHAAENVDVTT
jgi:cation diffusion facilitator CzcD-associated flavoprotein CzcO